MSEIYIPVYLTRMGADGPNSFCADKDRTYGRAFEKAEDVASCFCRALLFFGETIWAGAGCCPEGARVVLAAGVLLVAMVLASGERCGLASW